MRLHPVRLSDGSCCFVQEAGASTPALMDRLKGLTMSSTLIQSRLPAGNAKTVAAHEGGCYALEFDRSEPSTSSPCFQQSNHL